MKGKFKICFSIFSLLTFHSGIAQKTYIPFFKFDSLNGNSIGKITAICQDPDGIMWFCGQGQHCLYRYDGNNLTSFKKENNNPNSLGLYELETIYADDRGLIWIGGHGLDRYNPATGVFTHFRHDDHDSNSLNKNGVSAILKDHKGNIWIGTFNGLDRLDEKTGKFTHYLHETGNLKSLSNNVIDVIYEDKKSVLWIGTGNNWSGIEGEGGLNRMNPDGSFTRYEHDPKNPNSLLNNKIRAIFEDSRGNFWVGTSGEGLHIMDRDKGTFERHTYNPKQPQLLSGPRVKPGDDFDGITFICEDRTGNIWAGSYLEGLSRYDPASKEMARFKGGNGFPDSTTFKGLISRDGTLWVATENSELLYRADPGSKAITNIITGNQGWDISAKNGQIWIATWGGLLQYDENRTLIHRFRHDLKDSSSILSDTVWVLFQIPQEDTIWVGTLQGVEIFNTISKKFSKFTFGQNKDSLSHVDPFVFQDKKANFWIETLGGLMRYNRNDGSIRQWPPDPNDSENIGSGFISSIIEDREQNIWISIWEDKKGIWKLNKKTNKFHRYLSGIAGRNLYEDQEGDLWAGTQEGLFRYNKKADNFFAFFDPETSIYNEPTSGIEEDSKKNLWVSTVSAIVKVDPGRNSIFVFGKKYGISVPSKGIFSGNICITPKDQILVSNENGYYAFFPEDLNAGINPIKLVITDFFFNTASGLTGADSAFLYSAEKKNGLSLAYDQNNFGFKFTASDYRPPEAVRYYTMLENYDPVWRQSGADKTVYYFNLAPGDYVFRIKAYNSDETKGERQIRIHISPPWWKTGWAYVLYGLLFITVIITIARMQKLRIIREERQKTQAKELEQAREIEKAYTELKSTQAQLIQSEKMASLGELTAGIAHEIQNPLNFVNNFSEINMELTTELKDELAKMNIEQKYKKQLEEIADNINDNEEKISHHGRRADNIVKGMLQHSRISSGIKEPTDINLLADEYMRLSYHGLRAKDKSFNSAMKTDFDQNIGNINIVPQDIGRVLLNLYNNAFYAVAEKKQKQDTAYEPMVEVSTKKTSNKIEIRVKDNGDGIPKKVFDKIFQPFFTTKPTGQGTGLGLSLSFDIVIAHGGTITVDTKEGEYSTFIVSLPG